MQQATADQAFTNAKAAGDVDGMTAALVYRALERNTGAVGQASVLCTAVQAVNPEIAALSQHQDPASTDAAATNKQITLDLALQIASIGGDPTIALQSGTFAPGTIGDPTAKGNSCDTEDCIFSQNLLVEDATEDEINAAVVSAGVSTGASATVAITSAAATEVVAATSAAANPCDTIAAETTTGAEVDTTASVTSAAAVATDSNVCDCASATVVGSQI